MTGDGGEGAPFDRGAILGEVAGERAISVEVLERALYADLRGAHLLKEVRPLSPARTCGLCVM